MNNWGMITDWIMVCITLVYVIATIAICVFNYRSAKATSEQIKESARQFNETNRANITVTFEIIKGGLITLCIGNHGQKVAYDVSVAIDNKFLANAKEELDARTNQSIQSLVNAKFAVAIGQKLYTCLGSHLELKKLAKCPMDLLVTYRDDEKEYRDKIRIDFGQYSKWLLIYESPIQDIREEMKKQTKAFENILCVVKNH